ncbi:MAG: tetratricopeptide repeat protein [Candidatus Helarchaeales archaeon]
MSSDEKINDYETASRVLVRIGKKPKTEDERILQFQANYFLARHYMVNEQWANAQQYALNSLKSAKKVKSELKNIFIGRAHAILGDLHDRLQEYSLVKTNYNKSLKHFEKTPLVDPEIKIEYFLIFEKFITVLNRLNGIKTVLKTLQKYWTQNHKNSGDNLIDIIFLSPLLSYFHAHLNNEEEFFNYYALALISPFLKLTRDSGDHADLWEKKIEKTIKDGDLQLQRLFEIEKKDESILGKEYLEILSEMIEKRIKDVDHYFLNKLFEARKQIISKPSTFLKIQVEIENDTQVSPFVNIIACNDAVIACLQTNDFNKALELNKKAQLLLNKIKNKPDRFNKFLNGLINLNQGRILLKKQNKVAGKALQKAATIFEKNYLTLGHAALALSELACFLMSQGDHVGAKKALLRLLSHKDELKNPRILGHSFLLLSRVNYLLEDYLEAAISAGKASIIFYWMKDSNEFKKSLTIAINILEVFLKEKQA